MVVVAQEKWKQVKILLSSQWAKRIRGIIVDKGQWQASHANIGDYRIIEQEEGHLDTQPHDPELNINPN